MKTRHIIKNFLFSKKIDDAKKQKLLSLLGSLMHILSVDVTIFKRIGVVDL